MVGVTSGGGKRIPGRPETPHRFPDPVRLLSLSHTHSEDLETQ